jgi:aminoglycoside phosphotransferase (APT) family kinase protein
VAAPSLSNEAVLEFLSACWGDVEGLERLGGGFWSAAYGFRSGGRDLVARFGSDQSWFEADRSAMDFARAGLPVPEVLDVGFGLGGSYAISVRHYGSYLELARPERSEQTRSLLIRLFEALYRVPKEPDLPVGWHWQPPQPEVSWQDWLLGGLLHDADRDIDRWRARLAADPDLDGLFRAAESRIKALVSSCPERRDLVHSDLLHGNVLIADDPPTVTAVFSWKCSVRGDFIYDVAWCSFWGGVHPGIAAADPWTAMFASELIGADPAALDGAAQRHHCYELQIGVAQLGWNVWVGDDAGLAETARLLSGVIERGPLHPPAP